LLKTAAEQQNQYFQCVLFRQGKVIFKRQNAFEANLPIEKKKMMGKQFHNYFFLEIEKLLKLRQELDETTAHESTLCLLADGYMKYGMNDEAIAFLQPFLKNDSVSTQVLTKLSQTFIKIGKFEQAKKYLKHVLRVHSGFADLHFYFGVCEYYLQNCVVAYNAFTRAVEINPHYGEAYFYLGLTLILNFELHQEYELTMDLQKTSTSAFSKAADYLDGVNTVTYSKGLECLENEQFGEAFNAFTEIENNLADEKPEISNYDFHLMVLHEPDKISPDHVWKEVQRLNKLKPKYPNYPDIFYELGFAYAVLSASVKSEALYNFGKALELNPGYKNAKKGMKLIENDQRSIRVVLKTLLEKPV